MNWTKNRFHDLAWVVVVGAIAGGIWFASPGEDPVNKAAAGDRIRSRLNQDPNHYHGLTPEELAVKMNGSAEGIE